MAEVAKASPGEIVGAKFNESSYYKRWIEKGGTILAEIPSPKTPSRIYRVVESKEGMIYCNCPSWLFQKIEPKDRTCKHIKEVYEIGIEKCKKLKIGMGGEAPKLAPAKTKKEVEIDEATLQKSLLKEAEKNPTITFSQTWGRRTK